MQTCWTARIYISHCATNVEKVPQGCRTLAAKTPCVTKPIVEYSNTWTGVFLRKTEQTHRASHVERSSFTGMKILHRQLSSPAHSGRPECNSGGTFFIRFGPLASTEPRRSLRDSLANSHLFLSILYDVLNYNVRFSAGWKRLCTRGLKNDASMEIQMCILKQFQLFSQFY